MVDEEIENSATNYHEISSFLQSTWFEIPDRTSESRFMRPQFVEKMPIASTLKRQDEGSPPKRSEEQKGAVTNDAQHGEAQNSVVQETNDHGVNSQEANKREATMGKEPEGDGFISSSALYVSTPPCFLIGSDLWNYRYRFYRSQPRPKTLVFLIQVQIKAPRMREMG